MDPEEFVRLLKAARANRDEELESRFQRNLPFGDAMFDRWERARRLGFGEGASIYDSALVFGQVRVGAMTWIGPNVMLDGSGGPLSIGAWCSISTGVHIYTHDTVLRSLSGGLLPARTGAVSIGDFCYIGSQTVVEAGVRIGDQVVVGANSFVNCDVPDRSIFAGSPARRIGVVQGEGEDVKMQFDSHQNRPW